MCARLAADHFPQQRFRHFSFCGYPGINFSDQRCASFVEHVRAHGHTVNVFEPPRDATEVDDLISREARCELPNTQLDRIRVNRAKQLLVETEYKIAVIASMTGYTMAPQFVTAFRRLTGFTSGKYRESAIRGTS